MLLTICFFFIIYDELYICCSHGFFLLRIGFLNPDDLIEALSEVLDYEVTHKHTSTLMNEFDKDRNGKIDISEFAMMTVSSKSRIVSSCTICQTYG